MSATPDGFTNPGDESAYLATLAGMLTVHGFTVDESGVGLRVVNDIGLGRTIVCRPRPEDRDSLWFFTADGMPVAEADHLIEALVMVKGLFAVREGV